MNFAGKINAGMASFTVNMRNGVDNCKLDGRIAEQENRIKEMAKEIGNLVILKLEAGEEMSPEIMERYEVIQEAKETIETLKKEKKTTKAVCPSCGAKTSVGMKYCGNCGARMNEEE